MDTLHGVDVVDEYRWLEDGDSEETVEWVRAQNEHTRSWIDEFPGRARARERLAELLAIGTIGAPVEAGDRLFFQHREGAENQPRLMVREPSGDERTIVDPNVDRSGTTAIDWWFPSSEGRFVAFGQSSGGDEESTLHIVDVDALENLADLIRHARFSTVAWLPDSSGFYYTGNTKSLSEGDSSSYYRRSVYLHRLGTAEDLDEEVYPDDGDPETQPAVFLSRNGRWLLVRIHRGWGHVDLHLRDLSKPDSGFRLLTAGMSAVFNTQLCGDDLYLHTNHLAPRYRLLRVSLHDPLSENWIEIVQESPDAVLQDFVVGSGGIALAYLRNARAELVSIDADGQSAHVVELPALGSIVSLRGREGSASVYLAFESFAVPPTVLRYDLVSKELVVWAAIEPATAIPDCLVEQVWYPSRDGTPISMFIIRPRALSRDSSNPLLLTGYGGFNVPTVPSFSRAQLYWLEQGGTVAVVNLRGGSEYGEEWHKAGMLNRKQNVFDDFIAAGEHLVAEGYTSPARLAILGGSNGGLLIGAAFTQRPGLFRAAICAVPLLDMLRYQNFLIARLWIPEYGSAEDPQQFRYLMRYSPYHNVSDEAEYPAILFITADKDSRVDPMHARKMTARMQERVRSRGPILLRVEFEAGHGAGKPVEKLVDQYADEWTFLLHELGCTAQR
jgi:prolyl oligopeptidase